MVQILALLSLDVDAYRSVGVYALQGWRVTNVNASEPLLRSSTTMLRFVFDAFFVASVSELTNNLGL